MSEQKGLYDKYMVIKVVDGTVIEDCFILRPDKDPAAVKAMQAYAAATENKTLADDIYKWVGKPMLKPMTHKEAEDMLNAGNPVWHEEREDLYCKSHWIISDGINNGWLDTNMYGFAWRCWASKPTDEERAAAPWEE